MDWLLLLQINIFNAYHLIYCQCTADMYAYIEARNKAYLLILPMYFNFAKRNGIKYTTRSGVLKMNAVMAMSTTNVDIYTAMS